MCGLFGWVGLVLYSLFFLAALYPKVNLYTFIYVYFAFIYVYTFISHLKCNL